MYCRNIVQNTVKSYPQKKERRRCRELSPALHKLFSTILHNRLHSRRDQIQSQDWKGFWRSYQAIYHIATYRMIEQKCHEWWVKMWVATIDFVKACDFIYSNSDWDALNSCGIEHEYIKFLKRLYKNQEKQLFCVTCSRSKRGPSRVICYPSWSSTLYCRWPWKMTFHAGRRKKEMDICLGDCELDCLRKIAICWRGAPVCN